MATAAVLAALASHAAAVVPATLDQKTEADFSSGQFKSTAVNSYGEVSLSRQVKVLMPSDSMAVISGLAGIGESVYASSGSSNAIFKIQGGKTTKFAETPGTLVSCLVVRGQELIAGTGGDKAGVYVIDPQGRVASVWSDASVKYIWAIVPAADGTLYLATGPQGKILAVTPDGKGDVLYSAGKLAKNILCLAMANNRLYAGTDENGLVIEIDLAAKTSRVLLDCAEKEVSAVIPDASGGVFVATADTSKSGLSGNRSTIESLIHSIQEIKKGSAAPSTAPSKAAAQPVPAKPVPADAGESPDADQPQPMTEEEENDEEPAPASPRGGEMKMPQPRPVSVAGGESAGISGPGNAVYYVCPNGLVKTLFRRPVTILSMAIQGNALYLGTGGSGDIYCVSVDGEQIARIAHTESKQITVLSAGKDGHVYFGSANKASVGVLEAGFAAGGTFTSKALDARQIAMWGTAQVSAIVPDGTHVAFSTRSGNLAEVDDKTWSQWSAPVDVADGEFITLASPAGRFLQYRLQFAGTANESAVVRQVRLIYQVGNLAPVISNLVVQPSMRGRDGGPPASPDEKGPKPFRMLTIRSSDPNNDTLKYSVTLRQVDTDTWIKLTDKLTQPMYVWDTRTVADGKYELRVTASDQPSNPPAAALTAEKVTGVLVVDNTPPIVRELIAQPQAADVAVKGLAIDAGSRITSMQYSVDSQDEWVSILPVDGVCDSNKEAFSFTLKNLKPGAHRIAVRVEDGFGNAGYATSMIMIGK